MPAISLPTGMINLWGVPKPSMRAFEMLNLLAETEAEVTLSSNVSAATVGSGCCRDSDAQPLLRTDGVYKPVAHDAAATKATEEAASHVGNDGAPYCWTTNSCWGKFEDYEAYVDAFVEAYDPQILCFDVRQRAHSCLLKFHHA